VNIRRGCPVGGRTPESRAEHVSRRVRTSFLTVIARLRPDQSVDTATAALRQAQREIRESTIGELANFGSAVVERYLQPVESYFRLVAGTARFDDSIPIAKSR
jgi:hypothetical protein